MKIGVFDSGIGGQAVANTLQIFFPNATLYVASDTHHLPYGTKPPTVIQHLTIRAVQPLIDAACDYIIVACNTATTAAIDELRRRHPQQQFIGIEPMIKTAASLSRSGIIGVLATPSTLQSNRYRQLVDTHASHQTILQPDCSDWATMIQNNSIDGSRVNQAVDSIIARGGDVIVLGCTHYHWLRSSIEHRAGTHIRVIDPTSAIARRISQLSQL